MVALLCLLSWTWAKMSTFLQVGSCWTNWDIDFRVNIEDQAAWAPICLQTDCLAQYGQLQGPWCGVARDWTMDLLHAKDVPSLTKLGPLGCSPCISDSIVIDFDCLILTLGIQFRMGTKPEKVQVTCLHNTEQTSPHLGTKLMRITGMKSIGVDICELNYLSYLENLTLKCQIYFKFHLTFSGLVKNLENEKRLCFQYLLRLLKQVWLLPSCPQCWKQWVFQWEKAEGKTSEYISIIIWIDKKSLQLLFLQLHPSLQEAQEGPGLPTPILSPIPWVFKLQPTSQLWLTWAANVPPRSVSCPLPSCHKSSPQNCSKAWSSPWRKASF